MKRTVTASFDASSLHKYMKGSISKKIGLMIVGASLLSLLLGTPIALLKTFLFDLEIMNALGDTVHELLSTYFTLIINLIIIVVFVNLSVRWFVKKPIRQFIAGIEEVMSRGKIDLTKRIQLKTNDETQLLAQYFNQFLDALGALADSINVTVGSVNRATSSLHGQAFELGEASKQVAASMDEIAKGAQFQSGRTLEIVGKLQETKQLASETGKQIHDTSVHADTARNSAKQANEIMIKALHQLEELNASVQSSAAEMEKLSQKSEEIGSIVGVIAEIANQTNLLALNASIEAARAGEHGQGFAVVAAEVRKLSVQTRQASAQVSALIQSVHHEVEAAVGVMQGNLDMVAMQAEWIRNGSRSVEQVLTETEKTDSFVRTLRETVAVVEQHSDGVLAAMEEISSTVEQTSASLQEITGAAERQLSVVMQMGSQVSELDNWSNTLKQEAGKFAQHQESPGQA